ncbi:hypothetical protein LSG31_02060 [Fodinisporobacter ferrooxydans]|uniref:DUF4292 domain-containing protein n=1 Tax=Fodinisporobacter ferrooxydans TaxID=2901836 RepID=A0ABY4CM39_9BACL|nr:hypothetical protein LSG31_02060 [Alicyclobacillaceae bacterium MYW30-H2]
MFNVRIAWMKKMWMAIAAGSLLLTGCSLQLPSAAQTQNGVAQGGQLVPATAGSLAILRDAFAKSASIHRYGVKASISTTANNFTKTTTLYGHVADPDQVDMNEVIDGKSYMVIQTSDQTVVRVNDRWAKANRIEKSFNIFGSLEPVPNYAKKVYQLKDDTVISTPTYVYQFEANAADISSGIMSQMTDMAQGEKALPVRYTVWVGKKDHYIYQIRMQWSHAMPQLGNVAEDTTFMFFDLNAKVPIMISKPIWDQINKIPKHPK